MWKVKYRRRFQTRDTRGTPVFSPDRLDQFSMVSTNPDEVEECEVQRSCLHTWNININRQNGETDWFTDILMYLKHTEQINHVSSLLRYGENLWIQSETIDDDAIYDLN